MLDINAAVHNHLPKVVNTLPKPLLTLFIKTLQGVFHEKQFLDIYEKNHYLKGIPYVESMIEHLNITYMIKPNELQNIPSTGKLIIIANHVSGGQEAMILMQTIANAREDKKVKFLANSMLLSIKQISPLIIPVDNIKGAITKNSLKLAYEALENDEAIIIFPAGIVSRFTWRGIKDLPWKASFLKIARRTQTPILPIKVEGRNSMLFYLLSMILPNKITGMLLPHEFAIAGKRKPLQLHIGKVIPVSSFSDQKISIKEYLDLFYKHLYALGSKKEELLNTETTIGHAKNSKQLKREVDNAEFLGYTNTGKRIILTEARYSPFLMAELGRVRELSFRAIGGGTGSTRDNDLYDNHYKHLILWDDNDLEIVGAYRIGECKSIIDKMGIDGLYTSNFCNFNEHFDMYHDNSIELGRSFIQPKYWGSRAFDSLWQAVTIYLAHNPHIQYSYGVVTINANTPQKAVAALVYFYTHYFACSTKMMSAKHPYVMAEENQEEFDALFKDLSYKEGFTVLKKYLKNLDSVVPTLFKQYIELYEEGAVRYFDFSVNEGLFGVTEGFIIADNYRMKKSIQDRNLREFNKNKTIDPLTGLHTYEHFYSLAKKITQYRRKSDINFFIVIVSIDNYNAIQEKYGFFADRAIQKVSRRLKKALRSDDIIAKQTSEKFIMLLSNVLPESQNIVHEKIEKALEKLQVDGMVTLACSTGTAIYDYTTGRSLDEVLEEASKMLESNNGDTEKNITGTKNCRTCP